MKMTTFTLSPEALKSIATLHNATPADKSARDMTPILGAIKLTITREQWVAVATDRYCVAELNGPMGDYAHTLDESEPLTVTIESTDLVDVVKRMKRETMPVMVTVDEEEGTVQFNNNESVHVTHRIIAGNFPPVERLFDVGSILAEVPNVALDPTKLARLGKVFPVELIGETASTRNSSPLKLEFTIQANPSDTGRPGPMRVTRGSVAGYRALLQPNILTR